MTVLDSRPDVPGDPHGRIITPIEGPEALISEAGVTMAPVEDLGAGRGPFWLDDWLRANATDVLAWRRHIHAHPELSRHEFATTELVVTLLRAVGLKPWVLPGGTGVVCDIGSGDKCVALRADMDALPLTDIDGDAGPFFVAVRTSRTAVLVADARLPDHPVVYANGAFCRDDRVRAGGGAGWQLPVSAGAGDRSADGRRDPRQHRRGRSGRNRNSELSEERSGVLEQAADRTGA